MAEAAVDLRAERTLAWQALRGADHGVQVMHIVDHEENLPHDHVFHEIVYVEAGTAEHVSAEGCRRLRPGDVIVLTPQVWHAYRRPRSLTIYNCLIDSRLMIRLWPLIAGIDGAFDLLRRRPARPATAPPRVLHASPGRQPLLLARLRAMDAEQAARRNGWQAALTAGLLDLLVETVRLSRAESAGAPAPAAGRTEQAVLDAASYIEAHFDRPHALHDLAARVKLSPAHLSRHFSRRMGMGIVQFLHRTRAEEACRLLRCTTLAVKQVAAIVGYDEIAYFSRCFRAQVGQSPAAYRRQNPPIARP